MRIIIDMQSLQTGSSKRGIGRYSESFVYSLMKEYSGSDILFVIVFNDNSLNLEASLFLDRIKNNDIKFELVKFPVLPDIDYFSQKGRNLLHGVEVIRNTLIEDLNPDLVIVTSLFEYEAVVSIPPKNERNYHVAIILYDLIPLNNQKQYLSNVEVSEWYHEKINSLQNSDFYLCISDYILKQANKLIELPLDSCVNILGASDLALSTSSIEVDAYERKHHDLNGKIIFYVGGFDERKNVKLLISAFASLPENIIENHVLLLAGSISNELKKGLISHIHDEFILSRIIFLKYISDSELAFFYRDCKLFVFPSLDEGLGLPVIEAISFHRPVICSNSASLPEIVMNSDSLFNPRSQAELNRLLLKSLSDPTFIDLLTNNSIKRSKHFSWRRSAIAGVEFIQSRIFRKSNYARKMNYLKLVARSCSTKKELILFSQILAKASISIKKHNFNNIKKGKLSMIQKFSDTVPMYANSHNVPYVFSSMLCREQHFHMPLYSYWCKKLKENPKLHRKQWEFVYICHSLFERGMLKSGSEAIGFGVGKEPLASYYSSLGVKILATDLDLSKAKDLGWVTTDQHSDSLESLNEKQICPQKMFEKNTRFRSVDMNDIPADIGEFDFCWSSCAFEHLGSIEKGLNFVKNSCKLLKVGGVAVHTTEFNLTSNSDTLDNNPSFVIFRKKDIEKLSDDLEKDGFFMEEVDFSSGVDELEQYVDLPPYIDEPHLRLELAGKYVSTSIGLIIHRMR